MIPESPGFSHGEYVKVAHVVSYTLAGVIALRFSKDIYESKNRLCDFLNDMAVEEERRHVEKYFLPAQILRGLLMGIVLLPLLNAIGNLGVVTQFIFFVSLLFVYTHIAAVSPFLDNIEGQVYFKKRISVAKIFHKIPA